MGSGGSRPLWSPSKRVSKAGERRKAQGENYAPHLVRPTLPVFSCPCFFRLRPCGLGFATLSQGNRPLGFRRFCFALGLGPFACFHGNLYFCPLALAPSTVTGPAAGSGLSRLSPLALAPAQPKPIGCYRVKPHGQLVWVSCMHRCTSTPHLSTS
jgi:hypothetical protein